MSASESTEDESVCRMCHGESELERPLYFPCKCSGSIRYVHQDCLLQWLKTKTNNIADSKCELCGESYKFRKIYAVTGAEPPKLSVFEFLMEIVPQAKKTTIMFLQVFHAVILFAVCLPVIATCCSDICLSKLRKKPILEVLPSLYSPTQLLSTWLRGVGLLIFMGILTFAAERCIDFFLHVSLFYDLNFYWKQYFYVHFTYVYVYVLFFTYKNKGAE